MNALCRLLGIEIPIIQAPTASIAGPELAVAVSAAGALGSMGLTWTTPEQAVQQVAEVKTRTNKPFLVNFALAFEPKGLGEVLRARAPIVSFSWGNPAIHLPMVRQYGAVVGVQVGSLEDAKQAVDWGVDFIICQGVEAGGHVQASQSLVEWFSEAVSDCIPVPIVAAGGLSTGKDVARYLELGAQAVMLGTRFVATKESLAHEEYKRRLVEAAWAMATITKCFDGGWPDAPQGVLRNSTLDAWEAAGYPPPGSRPSEGETVAISAKGEPILRYEDTAPMVGMTGNIEAMAMYAGRGVGRINDIPTAGDLVRRLWNEARSANATGFPFSRE
jgi:nitronate monooxygenase